MTTHCESQHVLSHCEEFAEARRERPIRNLFTNGRRVRIPGRVVLELVVIARNSPPRERIGVSVMISLVITSVATPRNVAANTRCRILPAHRAVDLVRTLWRRSVRPLESRGFLVLATAPLAAARAPQRA